MTSTGYNLKDILNAPVEEAYRALRSNLQFCSFDKNIKSITFTSCNPGEGKTTTAINLGISMAKAGMKVLFVDADLRKPMLLKHLGSDSHLGLSNYISGHEAFENIVNHTSIDGFYFTACGPKPPNPSELLGSARFGAFLKTAQEEFDMVIIDTPPLGSVIDCAIIAGRTDASIIVIRANTVEFGSILKLKEQLEKANSVVLGAVLNRVSKSTYKSSFGHYNHYGYVRQMHKKWFKKQKVRR